LLLRRRLTEATTAATKTLRGIHSRLTESWRSAESGLLPLSTKSVLLSLPTKPGLTESGVRIFIKMLRTGHTLPVVQRSFFGCFGGILSANRFREVQSTGGVLLLIALVRQIDTELVTEAR
jgi:hypothetical protein